MDVDLHRPLYHFSPGNWMSRPVPFFDGKRYHLFFNHGPVGSLAAVETQLGHAVSDDLLRWETQPVAVFAAMIGGGPYAAWGVAVIDEPAADWGAGRYHLLLAAQPLDGGQPASLAIASSRDLQAWTVNPARPVLTGMPPGVGPGLLAPCCVRDGDRWLLVATAEGPVGATLAFSSRDLMHWECAGVVDSASCRPVSDVVALPSPGGQPRWALLGGSPPRWASGSLAAGRFEASASGALDADPPGSPGRGLASPRTCALPGGGGASRLLMGLVPESRPDHEQLDAGWAGILSLPRSLSVGASGELLQSPAPELAALRGYHTRVENLFFPPGVYVLSKLHPAFRGDVLEMHLRLGAPEGPLALDLRASQDMAFRCELKYNPQAGTFDGAPFKLAPGEPLDLRVYLDRSVIEVFVNSRLTATRRAYPDRRDCTEIVVTAASPLIIESLDAWRIKVPGLPQ